MMMIFEISKTHGTKHALSSSNAQNSIYPDHKTILFRRRNEKKTRHWNWGGEIWNLIEFFSINPYFPVKQEEIPAKKNVPILFPLYPSSVLPEQMNATGKKNMGKTKGLVEEEKWNKKEKWLKRNWYYFFCCWREREREERRRRTRRRNNNIYGMTEMPLGCDNEGMDWKRQVEIMGGRVRDTWWEWHDFSLRNVLCFCDWGRCRATCLEEGHVSRRRMKLFGTPRVGRDPGTG